MWILKSNCHLHTCLPKPVNTLLCLWLNVKKSTCEYQRFYSCLVDPSEDRTELWFQNQKLYPLTDRSYYQPDKFYDGSLTSHYPQIGAWWSQRWANYSDLNNCKNLKLLEKISNFLVIAILKIYPVTVIFFFTDHTKEACCCFGICSSPFSICCC